jgi:hypothetical protein
MSAFRQIEMSPSVYARPSLLVLQTRELDRLKCIQVLIDKQLKQKAVAERLGLTVRQVRRLVERTGGSTGVSSPSSGIAPGQIDGCEHAWFEDRAPQCTALVYVAADYRMRCDGRHVTPSL